VVTHLHFDMFRQSNLFKPFPVLSGAVVVVLIWLLDIQLPLQSVPITTDVLSSNFVQGEMYTIM